MRGLQTSRVGGLPSWPNDGLNKEQIMKTLNLARDENLNYDNELTVSFPGTKPLPISLEAFHMFAAEHANNICTHTSGESEKGFKGTQILEKIVIRMMAELAGAREDEVDGYISSGGNESNIWAMFLGREYLNDTAGAGPIAILTSHLAHYSIRKAAVINGLARDEWFTCQHCSERFKEDVRHTYAASKDYSGLHLLATDRDGKLNVEHLRKTILAAIKCGIRKFIIIASEGNVMTGAIDETAEIGAVIKSCQAEFPDIHFFLHVDSAFGGFVIPFLYPEKLFAFKVPQVCSYSVDPHKTGLTPYPAGTLIYRRDERNFRKYLGVQMGYVPGETDGTLCGSRPGASAAACYAAIQSLGLNGYRQIAEQCYDNTLYATEQIGKLGSLTMTTPEINQFAISHAADINFQFSKEFEMKIKLSGHRLPINICSPREHVKTWYKIIFMPHFTKTKVDQFISLLKQELATAKKGRG